MKGFLARLDEDMDGTGFYIILLAAMMLGSSGKHVGWRQALLTGGIVLVGPFVFTGAAYVVETGFRRLRVAPAEPAGGAGQPSAVRRILLKHFRRMLCLIWLGGLFLEFVMLGPADRDGWHLAAVAVPILGAVSAALAGIEIAYVRYARPRDAAPS